jgi:hypothetical protein
MADRRPPQAEVIARHVPWPRRHGREKRIPTEPAGTATSTPPWARRLRSPQPGAGNGEAATGRHA